MHNLSRRQMLGTAAALLAGGLAACGGSDPDTSAPVRTTLLVYLLDPVICVCAGLVGAGA